MSFIKLHLLRIEPRLGIDILVLVIALAAFIASYQANRIAQESNSISQKVVELYLEDNSVSREANELVKQAEQRGREEADAIQREKWYRTALEFAAKNRVDSLRSADLHGLDLSGVDLSGADLLGADLVGAVLDGANLSESQLTGANFTNASLIGVQLQLADLSKTIFHGSNLTDAQLDGAYLAGTEFHGTDLTRANLEKALYRFADAPSFTVDPNIMSYCACSTGDSCTTNYASCGHILSRGTCICDVFSLESEPISYDEQTIWPSAAYTSADPIKDQLGFFYTFYNFKLVHAKRSANATTQRLYLGKLGYLSLVTGYYQDAVDYYHAALDVDVPFAHDPLARPGYLERLGQAYRDLGDLVSATQAWQDAIVLYKAEGKQDDVRRIEEQISTIEN